MRVNGRWIDSFNEEKHGSMNLKLDMSKVYDIIDWELMED